MVIKLSAASHVEIFIAQKVKNILKKYKFYSKIINLSKQIM